MSMGRHRFQTERGNRRELPSGIDSPSGLSRKASRRNHGRAQSHMQDCDVIDEIATRISFAGGWRTSLRATVTLAFPDLSGLTCGGRKRCHSGSRRTACAAEIRQGLREGCLALRLLSIDEIIRRRQSYSPVAPSIGALMNGHQPTSVRPSS